MLDRHLALMTGIEIPVPACKLIIRQPTIKEISYLGETQFFIAAQCLCLNKNSFNEDGVASSDSTNFQIFMAIMSEKETADKKIAVQQLLTILLPDYKISFTPRSIILSSKAETLTIDEENFEVLQEVLRDVFCIASKVTASNAFNPADAAAKKIADKLMKAREIVAKQNSDGDKSTLSQYLSMITIGLHLSLKDSMNLTMYQLYDLIERYMLYTNWDMDIRSRLAGGKPSSQPDNWMKNIH